MEIARRLNGVTVGPFGAQWIAKPTDAEIARRVIRFLEDRRVLYNDYAWEEPHHCVDSVLEIRRILTEEMKALGDENDLLGPLRVIRAACRKFLDQMHHDQGRRVRLHYGHDSFGFYSALGELRGAIGPQIAVLAVHYRLDIEDELAKVLPLEDRDT